MHFVEIVVSGEAKRSRKQYESDAYFASVKASLAPGDDVTAALRAAQKLVDDQLERAVRGDAPTAPTAPVWHVKVDGPRPAAGAALRSVGLRFDSGVFLGEYTNKHDADKACDVARATFPSAKVTITPPPGGSA